MPRYIEDKPLLKPCTLREWKNFVLAEDSGKNIVGRFPKGMLLGEIVEQLAELGYAIRRAGSATVGTSVPVTQLPPGVANAFSLSILRQLKVEAAGRKWPFCPRPSKTSVKEKP
jgi:hypothetical protein